MHIQQLSISRPVQWLVGRNSFYIKRVVLDNFGPPSAYPLFLKDMSQNWPLLSEVSRAREQVNSGVKLAAFLNQVHLSQEQGVGVLRAWHMPLLERPLIMPRGFATQGASVPIAQTFHRHTPFALKQQACCASGLTQCVFQHA